MNLQIQQRFCAILLFAGVLATRAYANPSYDHVVVVVLENHSYDEILSYGATGADSLPYINGILRPDSASMTQAFGLEHPSQPNYYWIFSGSNQGLISQPNPDQPPTAGSLTTSNLGSSLLAANLTFKGFSLGLPNDGNVTDDYTESNGDTYVRRHVPWTGFQGLDGASINKTFDEFHNISLSHTFELLPTVSFVIPDLEHDMHNYPQGQEVGNATTAQIAANISDAWLQTEIEPYRQWALTHNSLLILTFDEDSSNDWSLPHNPSGLTDPGNATNSNQITMFFSGDGVVPGNYSEGLGVTNVNLLRTIESFYGLSPSGAQQINATNYGIGDGPITDIFVIPEPSEIALSLGGAALLAAVVWRRRRRVV